MSADWGIFVTDWSVAIGYGLKITSPSFICLSALR